MAAASMYAYVVERGEGGEPRGAPKLVARDDLPPGDVLIRVRWSSLNYKDAMAATGHPGVARRLPHVPGVDAAGEVVESDSPAWRPGDEVLVSGYELGAERWGGWAEYVRAPAAWIVRRPEGLSLRDAMIYGTAGFTAALCVEELQKHGVTPQRGEVLVTGASGGVGSFALSILARLGYRVAAVTGKPHVRARLERWGAARILSREEAVDRSDKPLLSSRWTGVVDAVGGAVLASAIRATAHYGCVAACGVAAGPNLPLTVYPFILRGVTLAGVDAAQQPIERRRAVWEKLAGPWRPPDLASRAAAIGLTQLNHYVNEMLAGRLAGRVIVAPAPTAA